MAAPNIDMQIVYPRQGNHPATDLAPIRRYVAQMHARALSYKKSYHISKATDLGYDGGVAREASILMMSDPSYPGESSFDSFYQAAGALLAYVWNGTRISRDVGAFLNQLGVVGTWLERPRIRICVPGVAPYLTAANINVDGYREGMIASFGGAQIAAAVAMQNVGVALTSTFDMTLHGADYEFRGHTRYSTNNTHNVALPVLVTRAIPVGGSPVGHVDLSLKVSDLVKSPVAAAGFVRMQEKLMANTMDPVSLEEYVVRMWHMRRNIPDDMQCK